MGRHLCGFMDAITAWHKEKDKLFYVQPLVGDKKLSFLNFCLFKAMLRFIESWAWRIVAEMASLQQQLKHSFLKIQTTGVNFCFLFNFGQAKVWSNCQPKFRIQSFSHRFFNCVFFSFPKIAIFHKTQKIITHIELVLLNIVWIPSGFLFREGLPHLSRWT